MKANNNYNAGKELLNAIQMYHFYLYDLNLYLDTHPNDKKALAKFNAIKRKLNEAQRIYNQKYGPLNALENNSEDNFYWVDGPWPWERGAN